MNYARVVDEIFSQFKGSNFSIRLWDHTEYNYGDASKKNFTLVIDDEKTARRLLSQGALGFGEAYMEGRLRVEGDIEAYLKLRHQFKKIRPSLRMALATIQATRSMPRDRKDQIAQHYDLGNDFFELILDDKTMSYSAGHYISALDSLSQAQRNKIELVCDWLDLPAASTVLDLGFGWGGFAKHAAIYLKWQITGHTLSQAQLSYCQELLKDSSCSSLVKLEYRDMLADLPVQKFDAIVMIESIEHVGQAKLGSFIANLYQNLKPGGLLYIQTTGRYKPRQADRWTLKYVFPGGYLPAKQELIKAATQAGFKVEKFNDDTADYIRTMSEWINNLEKNRSAIETKFDDSFYRLWELWMHGAKVAFEVNSMNLFRVLLRKPM